MRVEILHIDACPNWQAAGHRMRAALDATGHAGTHIEYVLIATHRDTEGTAFAGSPTILLDGKDPFPARGHIDELACRVYSTPDGLAGAPTLEQLEDALTRPRSG